MFAVYCKQLRISRNIMGVTIEVNSVETMRDQHQTNSRCVYFGSEHCIDEFKRN